MRDAGQPDTSLRVVSTAELLLRTVADGLAWVILVDFCGRASARKKRFCAAEHHGTERNSWSPFYLIFVKVLQLKHSAEMPGYHCLANARLSLASPPQLALLGDEVMTLMKRHKTFLEAPSFWF